MKRMLACGLVLMFALTINNASAQRVENGINVNSQPSWGPKGYDYVEYYYIPEIGIYYHVPNRQFIYQAGGHWTFSSALPSEHAGYDLFSGYKVVINEKKAYLNIDKHRIKYPAYKGRHGKSLLFRKDNEPRLNLMPNKFHRRKHN